MKKIDLTGLKFGTWTALFRSPTKPRSSWLCKCDCGVERTMPPNQLTRWPPYCECTAHRRHKSFAGKSRGYWTALKFVRHSGDPYKSQPIWLCRCICGTEQEKTFSTLRATSSCGCRRGAHRQTAAKAGGVTPTYRCWSNMVARCTQPSSPAFAYYQSRGITVCDRWRKFENFFADMGSRPGLEYSLDRHPNNDGNYEPSNVRWATKREQANNRITNIRFEYRDISYTMAELARATGVSKELLRGRLCRDRKKARKWTVETAVETPAHP